MKHSKYKKDSWFYFNILKDLLSIRMKSMYDPKGFLLRFGFDLLVANAGMFFGYLITIVYYLLMKQSFSLGWSTELIFKYYLFTLPFFTLACILAFPFSGLYSYGPGSTLIHRLFVIFRSISMAFLIFIFGIYLFHQIGDNQYFKLPRSSFLSGWVIALILMMSIRGGRIILYKNFIIMPLMGKNRLPNFRKKLRIVENESGWVSGENVVDTRGKATPIASRFALWPYFDEYMIHQVSSVLRSGKVNQWTGDQNFLFGSEFAEVSGCKYAVAVANGTAALELALHALDISPGDEVIVPCRTFIASASSVVMCGATPVPVDIDRESQNLTPQTIEKALSPRTKAIIAVHLAGWPCEMEPIMALARKHGIKVIEDCAQAHGAMYKGQPIGSIGDIAAFSFCQDKIVSTGGEGGMVTMDMDELWERVWSLKDHGKSYTKVHNQSQKKGFKWLHEDFGTNLRMTEMQAAIGRAALARLPGWVKTRQKYAQILTAAFSKIPGLRVTVPPDHVEHAYYKYYVFIRLKLLRDGWDRDRIMTAIIEEGIPCFSGICGQIHREGAFKKHGFLPAEELSVSEELMNTSLMFLVHPTLEKKNIENTIQAVKKVMKQAVSNPQILQISAN